MDERKQRLARGGRVVGTLVGRLGRSLCHESPRLARVLAPENPLLGLGLVANWTSRAGRLDARRARSYLPDLAFLLRSIVKPVFFVAGP